MQPSNHIGVSVKPRLIIAMSLCLLFFLRCDFIAVAAEPNRKCFAGPVTRSFGGTPWLVYACDDGQSIVIVSAPGSPAAPFIFSFMMSAGQYQLHGEGTGQKDLTDSALNDLKKLTAQDISMLVKQCQKVPSAKGSP